MLWCLGLGALFDSGYIFCVSLKVAFGRIPRFFQRDWVPPPPPPPPTQLLRSILALLFSEVVGWTFRRQRHFCTSRCVPDDCSFMMEKYAQSMLRPPSSFLGNQDNIL